MPTPKSTAPPTDVDIVMNDNSSPADVDIVMNDNSSPASDASCSSDGRIPSLEWMGMWKGVQFQLLQVFPYRIL